MKFKKRLKYAFEIENHSDISLEGMITHRDKKYDDSMEYFHLAAAMGNAQAMADLGMCYFHGRGCKKNYDLAFSYSQLAAKKMNIDGLYYLSLMYEHGHGTDKDAEAADYYLGTAFEMTSSLGDRAAYEYPYLFYSIAKKLIKIGTEDCLQTAYNALLDARDGYADDIEGGATYFKENLAEVEALLKKSIFDPFRDDKFEDWDDEDDEGLLS